MIPFHFVVAALFGGLEREQHDIIRFLREENRALKAQLQGRRLRLSDPQRRRLAVLGRQLGRATLRQVATIVTPDTILRWHRELVANKWTARRRRPGRPGVHEEIRRLVLRMAAENPTWGYTRLQGALRNVGHRVARATIARILKNAGVPPVPERPSTWKAFLKAHWPAVVAADFFTTEVWTARGLVTYYTLFVIELASRRVHVVGSTPHPDERFMVQAIRNLTDPVDRAVAPGSVLVCDRDRMWSYAVRECMRAVGVRVVQTPMRAPNCNAFAERLCGRSSTNAYRVIPLGEQHFRHTMREYLAHYHGERDHQGLGNELLMCPGPSRLSGPVRRRQRVGGILNYYHRAA